MGSPPPLSPSGATRAAWAVRGVSFLRPILAPSPGRRSGAAGGRQPSSASAPGLHCQNLTVPWPTEDQGPVHGGAGALLSKFDSPPRRPATLGQSGQLLSNPGAWEVRRSCRPEGDRGGGNNPGLLLPDVLPGPRRHPRRVRAAGGCQPLVCPWWPPHCRNATVPWPTEDQGPIHAAVGVPLSKFDSPSPPGDPGPAHGGTTCIVFPSSQRPPFRPDRLRRCGRLRGAHAADLGSCSSSAETGPRRRFGDR